MLGGLTSLPLEAFSWFLRIMFSVVMAPTFTSECYGAHSADPPPLTTQGSRATTAGILLPGVKFVEPVGTYRLSKK